MAKRSMLALGAGTFFAVGLVAIRLASSAEQQENPLVARTATYVVDCTVPTAAINPMIYGVGGAGGSPWDTGASARRWGGNPTTRYNWETNTWNVAKDWYFTNQGGPGANYETFLSENLDHGVKTALTVPMIGWVAKDATSYSFSVAGMGPQQAAAPERPDAGNGVARDGKPIEPGPPAITSVASTPESIERWVRAIREQDKTRGRRSVDSYILDNEPMLWYETHRDVHPQPTTYDELLDRTIAYATAIRRADPEAVIAGPAEWGWQAYHYSARDVVAGLLLRPDRRAHGDLPLIPWYLQKIREHEQRTGTRILDILDVHFYPMGDGIGIAERGDTDALTAAKRIRSTRSLWDASYVDESWINERMRVLPLLKEWIAANKPGTQISIGEWNFGAETHMSGGLATAEALGRFGLEGVASAYYWTSPVDRSPAFWAFRAFRNYDGKNGRFLDRSVAVKGRAVLASLFASSDESGRKLVAVLLNHAPSSALSARVHFQGCGTVATPNAFSYVGGADGFTSLPVKPSQTYIDAEIAPYSITVLEISTTP